MYTTVRFDIAGTWWVSLTCLGNGCQKAFYEDPNILYISLHVHMNGMFYPSGSEGDMYHCGAGAGIGK
jgi:histone deacetylase 6